MSFQHALGTAELVHKVGKYSTSKNCKKDPCIVKSIVFGSHHKSQQLCNLKVVIKNLK